MTPLASTSRTGTTFVFDFDEPPAGGRALLGGKGVGAGADGRISAFPCQPASQSPPTPASRTYRPVARCRRARGGDRRARPRSRASHGACGRRPRRPAAPLGALRRPDLDAGDDGLDPRSRPERPLGRRPRCAQRQPAVRPRLVQAAHPDVRRGRRGHRVVSLRAGARDAEGTPRRARRHRARCRRPGRADRAVQEHLRGEHRSPVPPGAGRPAAAGGAGRVRVVELASRVRVPARRTGSPTTSARP